MQSRIVLVSEDPDFYDFITPKLSLRKNDEIFRFKFNEMPAKVHLLSSAVLIINSENVQEKTLDLLELFRTTPIVIFAYNIDEQFKINVISKGALTFITPYTQDNEIKALFASALKISSILEKNNLYRDILVKKNLILPTNEVLLNYTEVLDTELERMQKNSSAAILVAISPDDKSKFLIQPNQIETAILNSIRKNDILMSYATNKYFLLLHDTEIENAKKIWTKIQANAPEKIYAGFAKTYSKTRQQLVNEVLNNLHESINYDKFNQSNTSEENNILNFKQYKNNFNKKIETIILPAFYHIKQKYNERLYGVTLEEDTSEGCSILLIKGRTIQAIFKITTPGLAKVNIDIAYQSNNEITDSKRISLNPEEFEAGLLEDLLEQFITEFKQEEKNEQN